MNPRTKFRQQGCSLIGLMLLSGLAYADANLNQPEDRITDRAIATDLATYESTQARIATLNGGGIPIADYNLSKAQCWLDVSLHEYTRNDRSPFPQQALAQADGILSALETKAVPSADTPLINNADRLREDLWERTTHLKNAKGFSCYAQKLACAEVELVHAGNENKQQGWRHAKPYIQIAEDLIADADATGESCLAPAPVAVVPPVPVTERLDISADALFKFDRAQMKDLLPVGKTRLDELAAQLRNGYVQIEKITLIGYTDRLGSAQYNQRLSDSRAQTVKKYLQDQGINNPIEAYGNGENSPIVECGTTTQANKALIACLQPNRRVTVEVKGIKNNGN